MAQQASQELGQALIHLQALSKHFPRGGVLQVLQDINLSIYPGNLWRLWASPARVNPPS